MIFLWCIVLPHFSLFFFGATDGMLMLVNLLAQCRDLMLQVFQLSLDLLDLFCSGFALCSRFLTDARGKKRGVMK